MKDRQQEESHKRTQRRLKDLTAEENMMPNDSRARCREGFDLTIADLVSIGKGEVDGTSAAARVRAIDSLAKYGYGKATIYIQNDQLLRVIGRITSKFVADREAFDNWIAEVKHALEKE